MGSLAQKRVLIIDDEEQMRRLVGALLRKEEADVFAAGDGLDGLRQLYEARPHLVILDVMMPGMDGWEVLNRIRQMADVPVIMLTVLNGGDNEVRALRGGANDFITKPFDPRALLARVELALRARPDIGRLIAYDDGYLIFDRQQRQVMVGGAPVHLTPKEFDILDYLIGQNGRVCTYGALLDHVWGSEHDGAAENVHVFIWQLRQKIEPNPREPTYIVNVPSVGYVFGGRARRLR